ncbi:hypothetical protein DAPPUDRAFT_306648 [Daphnia pulex]|uniref:LIM zinc-binding domain-containing protein n=1 Tax=Daphnia pulex TaxID=6669 RepID=E9GXI5_DAPPU|nr:hypothetical protein DAPPUDRAFT_306648 [Daphnia pulex]|eukprot:EFX75802.1 hypothetical protein DAPPUDRAFT_306648 [Daphnia pulex]
MFLAVCPAIAGRASHYLFCVLFLKFEKSVDEIKIILYTFFSPPSPSAAIRFHSGRHQPTNSNRPAPAAEKPVPQAPAGEGCPRCGGHVYEAERMLAGGRSWHKKCYKCKDCRKHLDSTNCCEAPDKEIYCKRHLANNNAAVEKYLRMDHFHEIVLRQEIRTVRLRFWSRCRNFAERRSDSFEAIDTKTIKAPEGQGCPRCGGSVFAAELMLSKGQEWHKKCFSCGDCHRPLDSVLACDGPNKDIYCKACYGKRFGPKGFGYGHSPTLVCTTGTADVPVEAKQGLKAAEGEGCPRCGFCVYAAEQMISKTRVWHKRCFNCSDCHHSLDSTNLNDGPDNDIYCVGCYRRKFGPHGVGYGMGGGALQTF